MQLPTYRTKLMSQPHPIRRHAVPLKKGNTHVQRASDSQQSVYHSQRSLHPIPHCGITSEQIRRVRTTRRRRLRPTKAHLTRAQAATLGKSARLRCSTQTNQR